MATTTRETKAQKQARYDALVAGGMSEDQAKAEVYPPDPHPVSDGEWLAPVNERGKMLVSAETGESLEPDKRTVEYDKAGVPTVTEVAPPEGAEGDTGGDAAAGATA
jgi:hypothetical protein